MVGTLGKGQGAESWQDYLTQPLSEATSRRQMSKLLHQNAKQTETMNWCSDMDSPHSQPSP